MSEWIKAVLKFKAVCKTMEETESITLYYIIQNVSGAYRVIERDINNDSCYTDNKKKLDREISEKYVFSREITKTEADKAYKYLKYLGDLLRSRG